MSSSSDKVSVTQDVNCTGAITVTTGILEIGNCTLSCSNDLNIYDRLSLFWASSGLNISGDIYWWSGSNAFISHGTITCAGNWYFYEGSDVYMSSGATVHLNSPFARTILNASSESKFGSLVIGGSSAGAGYTMHSDSTHELYVYGNLTINAGNELDLNMCDMYIYADLNLYGKLDIHSNDVTTSGKQYLYSSSNLNIDSGTFICSIHGLSDPVHTTTFNGTLYISSGTLDFQHQGIVFAPGSVNTLLGGTIGCNGIKAEAAGTFQPAGGTVKYHGMYAADNPTTLAAGNWLPNLIIESGQNYLGNDLLIKGDFELQDGTFDVQDTATSEVYDISISGNWSHPGGTFYPRTGCVTFNGTGDQYIYNDENFNTLELNKSSGYLYTDPAGTTVAISQYDWTAGNMKITAGTLNINDLADNGMYGGFYCGGTGVFNIVQDAAQSIDLYGSINVSGGTMNISGGNGDAKWAGTSASTVNISAGLLHYHEQGLQILSTHALSHALSGGKISTVGDLFCNRTDFAPTGISFEMRGNTDSSLDLQTAAGSSYNLSINKDSLSHKVTQASSSQTVRGNLDINNGTYYMSNRSLNCLGNLSINDSAKLYCQNNNNVKMGSGKLLSIGSGGFIEVLGSSDATRTTFTRYSTGYYAFQVMAGATLSADYVVFEYMGADGVNIMANGIVDGLQHCIFQCGAAGGRLLTINSSQDLTIDSASFPTNTWSGAYNVSKPVNSGSVYFSNWSGAFGGPAYEQDSYNRINWQGTGAPQITDLEITYLPATSRVQLSWTYPQAATSYKIYRSLDPAGTFSYYASTSTTSWSEVLPGPKYFYKVTAVTP